jgi:hypothetical protein
MLLLRGVLQSPTHSDYGGQMPSYASLAAHVLGPTVWSLHALTCTKKTLSYCVFVKTSTDKILKIGVSTIHGMMPGFDVSFECWQDSGCVLMQAGHVVFGCTLCASIGVCSAYVVRTTLLSLHTYICMLVSSLSRNCAFKGVEASAAIVPLHHCNVTSSSTGVHHRQPVGLCSKPARGNHVHNNGGAVPAHVAQKHTFTCLHQVRAPRLLCPQYTERYPSDPYTAALSERQLKNVSEARKYLKWQVFQISFKTARYVARSLQVYACCWWIFMYA